jgi:hypothetical protein
MTISDETAIDVERLMKEASEATGLYDFGPDDFIEPMTRFMAAAVREANLTPAGLASLPLDANRWLVNRLRVQADIARHPDILDEDVSNPIVIVGVPRTGTTKLHRLLGCDPGLRTLPFWKILNPAPFPAAPADGADPRLEIARQYALVLQQNFPDLMLLHPFVPEEPEEEVVMLEMTCRSLSACLFFRVPTFFEWLTAQSQVPQYEYLRTLLQHQQWLDGGGGNRPWVLKSPMHLGRIDALLEVFPGATLVHCHRDLATSMLSICNLVEAARRIRTNDVDAIELGEFLVTFLAGEWSANLRQRQMVGDYSQIIDLDFDLIRTDAGTAVRQIYTARGKTLSSTAEAAMAAWENSNHERHGAYPHDAEHYGLTAARIHDAFRAYREHFA